MTGSLISSGDATVTFDDLSNRQQDIILLISRGWSQQQIARHFGTSLNTVRNQIVAIYEEIGVTNRVQVLRWALEQSDVAKRVLDEDFEQ